MDTKTKHQPLKSSRLADPLTASNQSRNRRGWISKIMATLVFMVNGSLLIHTIVTHDSSNNRNALILVSEVLMLPMSWFVLGYKQVDKRWFYGQLLPWIIALILSMVAPLSLFHILVLIIHMMQVAIELHQHSNIIDYGQDIGEMR
jgi:hypothetical protein